MNKDLIIGILTSFLIHFLALDPAGFFQGEEVVEEVKSEPPPVMELIEMPEIEPPEPEVTDQGEQTDEPPPEFAPPMQQDVPSLVTVDTPFQQVLQPPPPPSTPTSTGVTTVPVNRNIGAGKIANLFDIKDLDQVPQPTYQPPPQYPYDMKRQGQSGYVEAGFIVDVNGNVRDPYVISSTSPEFEEPVLQALRKWRFNAGKKSGKKVNTRVKQGFPFKIENAR